MADLASDQEDRIPGWRHLICERYYKEPQPFAEGGFAEIYRGWIVQVGTPVIVKLPKAIHCTPDKIEQTRARWQREADRPARIPFGAQRCIELTDWEGRPCLILEYVDGISLRTYLQELDRQALSCDRILALEIASQIAETIAEAHSQGMIHRDITPANILLSRVDEQAGTVQVTIIDWGISKSLVDDRPDLTSAQLWTAEPPARYVAPEGTSELTEALDVYSLGVVLYELLGGLRDECRSRLALVSDIEKCGTQRLSGLRDVLEIVCRCLTETGTQRRSMKSVWRELQELLLYERTRQERELASQLADARRDNRTLEKNLEKEQQAHCEVARTASERLKSIEDKHRELLLTQDALHSEQAAREVLAEKARHLEARLHSAEARERNLNSDVRAQTTQLADAAMRYSELKRSTTLQIEGLHEQVALRDKQIDELKERLGQLPQEGFVTVDVGRWRELNSRAERQEKELKVSSAAMRTLRIHRRLAVGAIALVLVLGGAGIAVLQNPGAPPYVEDSSTGLLKDAGMSAMPVDQGQKSDAPIVPSVLDGGLTTHSGRSSDGGESSVETRWQDVAINGLDGNPANLLSGWADGSGTVYAVGRTLKMNHWSGLLLRSTNSGESFRVVSPQAHAGTQIPALAQYYAIGGLADGQIVVGGIGVVLVLDKRGELRSVKQNREGGQPEGAVGQPEHFRGIWTDANSAYLVSETAGGMMYKLKVTSEPPDLIPVPLGSGNSLIGVTGCDNSVWAVGTGATVRRYDKQSEKLEKFDPLIWRLSAGAAQASSSAGVPVEPKEDLWSVACHGKEVVACGTVKKHSRGVAYYSQTRGKQWQRLDLEFPCFSIHSTTSGEYFLGGENHSLLSLRIDATGISQQTLTINDNKKIHNIKHFIHVNPYRIIALDWQGKILLRRTE